VLCAEINTFSFEKRTTQVRTVVRFGPGPAKNRVVSVYLREETHFFHFFFIFQKSNLQK
jgi:hypothetical protein